MALSGSLQRFRLPFFKSPGGGENVTTFPPVVGPADTILTATIVALVAFGVVMVYSASAVYAGEHFGSGHFFFVRQAIFAGIGLVLMVAAARFDYHRYRSLTYLALGISVALLAAVILGLGDARGGATRWIHIGPINIQPAEVSKLALILWLAYSLSKKSEKIRSFSVGFLPHALVAGGLMLLCYKQPDFGSAVMLGMVTFVLLFAAGAKTGYLLGAILVALPIGYSVITNSAYRMRRITAFLDPFEHRFDEGYQLSESLMSFGAGGVTGVGIGDSRQKLFFLPEAHNDFISAIVGEELGFIGIVVLIIAFLVVAIRGFQIVFSAADDYGTYLALGITTFIGLQAFTNLAMAMGMLPPKGLVLPFISYGGSSLLVNCVAVGILLNVSRPRKIEDAESDAGRQTGRSSERGRVSRRHGRPIEGGAT